MPIKTDELRTKVVDIMPSAAEVTAAFPLSEHTAEHIIASRRAVEAILHGQDNRLLVVIGPCSIHDTNAGLDYAKRLKSMADKHKDSLLIVMRTYFEKPRTVVGWKGLINDPRLDGSCNLREGLFVGRKFLQEVNALGMPTATEFLDMITGQYIADLVTWGAIGARTTESQIHREMASGMSCPIGFKNGTNGNVRIAIDAIRSSQTSHLFCGPDKEGNMTIYRTAGNPYGHVILRGGIRTNYDSKSVNAAVANLNASNLSPHLIVDFSHANCHKNHKLQLEVAEDVCQQLLNGERGIVGVMAESFITEGNQVVDKDHIDNLVYGQSITDPCIGWEDTEFLLQRLADTIAIRNSKAASNNEL